MQRYRNGCRTAAPAVGPAGGGGVEESAAADPGLGEGEFDAAGGFDVAGEGRGDGADQLWPVIARKAGARP